MRAAKARTAPIAIAPEAACQSALCSQSPGYRACFTTAADAPPQYAEGLATYFFMTRDPDGYRVEVLDLRDPDHCRPWGIDPGHAAIPWLPERAQDLPASTWRVSDHARDSGADGMIYTARTQPDRWHLVLFRWPTARLTGTVLPYPLPGSGCAINS